MVSGAMAALGSRIEADVDRRPSAFSRWLTRERVAPILTGLAILVVWQI